MDISKIKTYLYGQGLVALIGALLLIFSDFAGFYYYDFYYKMAVWGYIYLGSGFLGTTLIIIGIGSLLFSLYFTVRTLILNNKISTDQIKKNTKNSIKGGIVTAGLAAIGGLVFAIDNIIEGTQSWWLDWGFYGSLIAGILIIAFGKVILKEIGSRK